MLVAQVLGRHKPELPLAVHAKIALLALGPLMLVLMVVLNARLGLGPMWSLRHQTLVFNVMWVQGLL